MAKCICIIDAFEKEKNMKEILTLNAWGKPIFTYVLDEVLKLNFFDKVVLLTQSLYLKYLAERLYGNNIIISDKYDCEINVAICKINGHAVMLKKETIEKAWREYKNHQGGVYSVHESSENILQKEDNRIFFRSENRIYDIDAFIFYNNKRNLEEEKMRPFLLSDKESLVIKNVNDFELALVLINKENKEVILNDSIKQRIIEKQDIMKEKSNKKSICFIGHSQLDNWNINKIRDYDVKNCGIRGISSFQYNEYIFKENKVNLESDIFLVMHGTNDIVYEKTEDEIVLSIKNTFDYIRKHKENARILFLSCLHTNGRLDRNNQLITSLNIKMKQHFEKLIEWIDTSEMDDEFGNLRSEYTYDGLHLTSLGYEKLLSIVEKEL